MSFISAATSFLFPFSLLFPVALSATLRPYLLLTLFAFATYYLYRKYQWFKLQALVKASPMQVIIIGAGFGGINMGIILKKAGIPFVIFEKGEKVGGTWYYNKYPGVACDIQSHLYSLSYELNPNWSKPYSDGAEILQYLEHVVDKYGLKPHIRFQSEVTSAQWNQTTSSWKVETRDGGKFEAQFIVGAAGPLHHPLFPEIKDRQSFQGEAFHTTHWQKDYNPAGKKLAIIGTGASAIQVLPEVSKVAERAYVFQRTPPWLAPREARTFSSTVKTLFRWFPFLMRLYRWKIFLLNELIFNVIFKKKEANPKALKYFTDYLHKNVTDDKLRKALTPTYPPGCKRLLFHESYLTALERPNVTVVTDSIEQLQPEGVVAGGKLYPVDTVIYATGFKTLCGYSFLCGKSKRNLDEALEDPKTYLGIVVPDFPNFFQILGPGTGLGHNSVIFILECQVQYIVQCITHMILSKRKTLEVKQEVVDEYTKHLQTVVQSRVWASPACHSWYKKKDGSIFALWHGTALAYWKATRTPNFSYFQLV